MEKDRKSRERKSVLNVCEGGGGERGGYWPGIEKRRNGRGRNTEYILG